jgi:hypothetical protein
MSEGTHRPAAEPDDFCGYRRKPKAGGRKALEITEVLHDENSGAEQDGVDWPALVCHIVDVERIDTDQHRPAVSQKLGSVTSKKGVS